MALSFYGHNCFALCNNMLLTTLVLMMICTWPTTISYTSAIRIDSPVVSFHHQYETTASSSSSSVDFEEQLRKLNKPALKSILSSDGDIIDCIPVLEQLAFDHPLLKDHKIQKAPAQSNPEHVSLMTSFAAGKGLVKLRQVWHDSGESCPEDTISVRRIRADDPRTTSSHHKRYRARNTSSSPTQKPAASPTTGHEYAIAQSTETQFYGAKAIFNVWSPSVGFEGEFSLSQLWLTNGAYDDQSLNTVEVGWQVLYGETNPSLFVYWTRDAYSTTGCYDLRCPGFVQVDNTIVLGAPLSPVSIEGGNQVEISIAVTKDPQTGNWWLYVNDVYIGYWPQSIFTLLQDFATKVQWGGEIVNKDENGTHTTTQMGSGEFAEDGLNQAAYTRNLEFINSAFSYQIPSSLSTIVTNPSCYDIDINTSDTWGSYFFFGGPGRNSNCI